MDQVLYVVYKRANGATSRSNLHKPCPSQAKIESRQRYSVTYYVKAEKEQVTLKTYYYQDATSLSCQTTATATIPPQASPVQRTTRSGCSSNILNASLPLFSGGRPYSSATTERGLGVRSSRCNAEQQLHRHATTARSAEQANTFTPDFCRKNCSAH
jgi:hypothetical protein